jgi:hypothetical protein
VKTALVTDLHANREAVETVLAHAREQGAEAWAFLGDFVGYGADPAWVIDLVREHVAQGAVVVQGNHDLATVLGTNPMMRIEARAVIEWTRAQLDEAQLEFLRTLPMSQRRDDRLYVHANAYAPDQWEYLLNANLGNLRRDGNQKPIHGVLGFSKEWKLVEAKADGTGELQGLLVPMPDDGMDAYPVETLVNNVRNDGPALIVPFAGPLARPEQTRPTSHPKIRVWELPRASSHQIRRMLELLESVSQATPDEIRAALRRYVPEYRPDASAPAQIEPQPSAPPAREENPDLFNEIGKLFEKSKSMLPPLKSPSETFDDLNARARDAGESLSNFARPSTMVSGRAACVVAANGAPDCKAGADRLCQSKGYKEGKGLDTDAAEKCSPKVYLPGRKREPGDCRTENYVTRALCQ